MKAMTTVMMGLVGLAMIVLVGCDQVTSSPKQVRERKLQVTTSGPVTIQQGGTATLTLTITRLKGLTGPVSVMFGNLPPGIEVVAGDRQVTGDTVTYTLRAGNMARVISSAQVPIFLKAKTGDSATAPFGLTVEAKPGEEKKATTPAKPAAAAG